MDITEILHLTQDECDILEKMGSQTVFDAGQMVYLKGDVADNLYYIKKGRVRVFDNTQSGREITVDVIKAGHIFGESAFGSALRPINVVAVNQVVLVAVNIETLSKHLSEYPTLALHLLQLCSDTMDRLMNRVEEQCLLDRYGKIASFLLEVTSIESEEKGTVGGLVPYTHNDLADCFGLNRTTVSAVLKYFDQKKWISCGYGKIQVVDREKLREFVEAQKV